MRANFHRPKPIPLIMSVGGVLLMLTLGIWQLQRLEWKEGLIASIEQANQAAPLRQAPATLEDATAHAFYRVKLRGTYLPDHAFHIAARYFENQLGYHILVPFQLEEGAIVLVNRGWIPAKLKSTDGYPSTPTAPRTLTAMIRVGDERNYFTPQNQPDRNIWFGRDVAEMARFSKLKLLPYTLDRIGTQNAKKLPVPAEGTIALRNDHLNYAIIWFGIGLGIAIISLLYHRK